MVGGVKCDADEEKRDGKHKDASNDVHLYNLPISSIRRWIWRWSIKIPKPSNTAVAMASESNVIDAVCTADATHPTRLISATTMIPSQSRR